ncbi:MAG: hypothetical protein IMZ43_11010 [Thermoplasmata archaeon]|nr:hypothetical protein [Thermoplasmata archaeon]
MKDGNYTGAEYMIVPTKSGTAGNPITIIAENDGQVTIDGQNSRIPLDINGKSYIDIEGIVFKNSNQAEVVIRGTSSYINIRRVSASKSNGSEYNIFEVSSGNHILIEDSVAYGTTRKLIAAYGGTSYITFRRNWGQFSTWTIGAGEPNFGNCMEFYGDVQNSFIENNICTRPGSTRNAIA